MQSPDFRLVTETKLANVGVTVWKALTAYRQGQAVYTPAGSVVTALTDFTSGASYDATNWSAPVVGVTDYNALNNKPTLGTAAAQPATAFDPEGAAITAQAAAAADATAKVAAQAASDALTYVAQVAGLVPAVSAGASNAALIQTAIDAAGTAGGGEVRIPAGLWTVTPLQMRAHVTLRGAGAYATALRLANGSNTHLLSLASTSANWVGVVDLQLDGNKANQSAGHVVSFDQGSFTGIDSSTILDDDPNHYFRRVVIRNGKQDGLHLTGSRGQSQFVSVIAYENDGIGFWWESADNHFDHCISANNGLQGFYCWGAQSRLLGCKAFFNGQIDPSNGEGYTIRNSRTNLEHCEAQDNRGHGFVLVNVNSIILDGMAERNGLGGLGGSTPGGTADGLFVSGLTNSRVTLLSSDRNEGGLKQRWAYNAAGVNSGNLIEIVSSPMQSGVIGVGDWGATSAVTTIYPGTPLQKAPSPTLGVDGNYHLVTGA